jgi:hypothetical protein
MPPFLQCLGSICCMLTDRPFFFLPYSPRHPAPSAVRQTAVTDDLHQANPRRPSPLQIQASSSARRLKGASLGPTRAPNLTDRTFSPTLTTPMTRTLPSTTCLLAASFPGPHIRIFTAPYRRSLCHTPVKMTRMMSPSLASSWSGPLPRPRFPWKTRSVWTPCARSTTSCERSSLTRSGHCNGDWRSTSTSWRICRTHWTKRGLS